MAFTCMVALMIPYCWQLSAPKRRARVPAVETRSVACQTEAWEGADTAVLGAIASLRELITARVPRERAVTVRPTPPPARPGLPFLHELKARQRAKGLS